MVASDVGGHFYFGPYFGPHVFQDRCGPCWTLRDRSGPVRCRTYELRGRNAAKPGGSGEAQRTRGYGEGGTWKSPARWSPARGQVPTVQMQKGQASRGLGPQEPRTFGAVYYP